MNILMFLVGSIIFIIFITGQIVEIKQHNQREMDNKNYYERYNQKRNKNPKTKKGSQSRMKNYNNKWQ
jgi:hypothetical protein